MKKSVKQKVKEKEVIKENVKYEVTSENWIVGILWNAVGSILATVQEITGADGQLHFELMSVVNRYLEQFRNECHALAYQFKTGIRKVETIDSGLLVFGAHEHGIALTTMLMPNLLEYIKKVKETGDMLYGKMVNELTENCHFTEKDKKQFVTKVVLSWGNVYDMFLTNRTTGACVNEVTEMLALGIDERIAKDSVLIRVMPWHDDAVSKILDIDSRVSDDYLIIKTIELGWMAGDIEKEFKSRYFNVSQMPWRKILEDCISWLKEEKTK